MLDRGRFGAVIGVAIACFVVAGCNGSNADVPAADLTGNAVAGKAEWKEAGCWACHTMSAAAAKGTYGPNLDTARPSYEDVVTLVTKGRLTMPTYASLLEPQQIADIGQYVVESTGG